MRSAAASPRGALRTALREISTLAIMPALILYSMEATLVGRERAFRGYSQALSMLPGPIGDALRVAFYQRTLRACGPDTSIGFGTIFSTTDVAIGARAYIGAYSIVGHCRIGNDALIGSRVSIISGLRQHGIDDLEIPMKEQPGIFEVTVIEDDCFVGEGAVVAARLGAHSVVAAGSVVHREVAPYSIVKGNPAELARMRYDQR